jgi:hypothetical protein
LHDEFLSSSGNSEKCIPDFEEEVGLIPEAIGHALDDHDLVVAPLEHPGDVGNRQ